MQYSTITLEIHCPVRYYYDVMLLDRPAMTAADHIAASPSCCKDGCRAVIGCSPNWCHGHGWLRVVRNRG